MCKNHVIEIDLVGDEEEQGVVKVEGGCKCGTCTCGKKASQKRYEAYYDEPALQLVEYKFY